MTGTVHNGRTWRVRWATANHIYRRLSCARLSALASHEHWMAAQKARQHEGSSAMNPEQILGAL
jgi:hypothetical protein